MTEYERAWLYPAQEAAIFTEARYAVIEASTKSGKTVGCMAWLLEQAALRGGPGRHFWWVAPYFPIARIAYERMKRAVDRRFYSKHDGDLRLTLSNGSVLEFKSGDNPDGLYGQDVYAAVIDEASRCRQEAWWAIRTTLTATDAPCRIIGNVRGRKNWAYHLARKAEAGEPDYSYSRLTVHDAIEGRVIPRDAATQAQRDLPEHVYRELYLAEPSDDAGNPFGLQHIAACTRGSDWLSPEPPMGWGWDLAKSVDWTVGVALDPVGAVCAFERFQDSWQRTIDRIQLVTGKTPALVDSTGVGDPVLESLQAGGNANYQGFHFTGPSKQQLMEGLAVAIQRHEVSFPDGPIRAELDSFEYEVLRTGVRYSAPSGMHDDCVCGLALAVHLRGEQARRERDQYFRPEWFRKVSTDSQPAAPEVVQPGPATANRYVSAPPRPSTPRYPALTDEDADILRARFAADKPVR